MSNFVNIHGSQVKDGKLREIGFNFTKLLKKLSKIMLFIKLCEL